MTAPAPTFHDPPSRKDEADAVARELAGVLVGAPAIPIELPRFSMRLLSIRAAKDAGIELVLGHDDPTAALRIGPSRRGDVVPLGKSGPVKVEVRTLHASAEKERAKLDAMALRLERAIDAGRWARAVELAPQLRALQVDVPMEHYRQLVEGTHEVGLVRVGFGCNQDCGLCWQDRDWPRHSPEQVRVWISDLRAAGATQLIISGGEPTLDRELPSYLEHARAIGFRSITLETNAIQCAKPGVAARLKEAGLDVAFVSLHSADPDVSDAITRAPGTHVRTVAGMIALREAGVPVKVNCVMTAEGLASLPALPGYLVEHLGRFGRISLMLSYPSDAFDAALVPQIRPEPDALRVALRGALDRAVALGVEIDGIDGPCGPPLCAHGADRRVVALTPRRDELSFRRFVPACDRCAVKDACPGVRPGDVEAFGDRAVRPLATRPDPGTRAE